jgi:glucokinase
VSENKYIGVDLGGTSLRVGLVKGNRVLKYEKMPTPRNKDELLKQMCEMITLFNSKDIKAIGVGSPGPLKDGVIKNPPNLPLRNFDLQTFLKKKFKKKVVVGNDADAVALSEAMCGVRKKNFFILTLGTGIGGGIIVDGKLYTGNGYGGELGHIIINNGRDLESHWKDHKSQCKAHFGRELLIKELLDMNDKRAFKILDELSTNLAMGIASLIVVLDPEVVVLMGGARETGDRFLSMIRDKVDKYNILPKKTPIVWSTIPHPGILGSSLFVR